MDTVDKIINCSREELLGLILESKAYASDKYTCDVIGAIENLLEELKTYMKVTTSSIHKDIIKFENLKEEYLLSDSPYNVGILDYVIAIRGESLIDDEARDRAFQTTKSLWLEHGFDMTFEDIKRAALAPAINRDFLIKAFTLGTKLRTRAGREVYLYSLEQDSALYYHEMTDKYTEVRIKDGRVREDATHDEDIVGEA